MKYPHYKKLLEFVNEGWVDHSHHSSLPLTIYNYSRKTQYDKFWNEITLETRGLILDNQGEIIAKGFPKFFNYEELNSLSLPQDWKSIIKKETPIIQDKMDGSLGILFHYAGEWHMSTKGSFHSEQAIRGLEIFKNKYNHLNLWPSYVYLVEIIYPENRIVLDYGYEDKLVFLSVHSNSDNLNWRGTYAEFIHMGLTNEDIVKTYNEEFNFGLLKNKNIPNQEGYVVLFEPSKFRLKIKFEEYIRLHKIMTNLSTTDIWDCLVKGNDINILLQEIPDEADGWVREQIKSINDIFVYIETECKSKFKSLVDSGLNSRKDQAEWIQNNVIKRYHSVMFAILDNKDYKPFIYKLCKPKYEKIKI